mgnify:FL=1
MLRWTPAGAVTTPDTVQMRVEPHFPDRLPAGAPAPTRRLGVAELQDNIRYFTEGLDTPRSRPCRALVLSGHGVATREDVPEAIALGRSLGIRWVVVHAGSQELPRVDAGWMKQRVDRLVVPIHSVRDLDTAHHLAAGCRKAGVSVVFAIDLRADLLAHLGQVAHTLDQLGAASMVFTWPFPAHGLPALRAPGPGTWKAALTDALAKVTRTARLVRGLPACHLGELPGPQRRTSNRWYVDADHQQRDALLFLPDVVAFHKPDACRFCAHDGHCDGFFSEYLEAGHPPLQPM